MINLAWGGYTNGEIPTTALVDVSGRGDYLEPTAAANFLRMQAAILRDVGFDLQPAAGSSANRSEATQITFFTQRYTKVPYNTGLWWNGSYWTKNAGASVAAIPRTSNHGWARAIDLNISRYDTAAWAWMQAHAHEYGYDWATGEASGEDWHWESLTTPGTAVAGDGSPITLEDELSAADVKAITSYIDQRLAASEGRDRRETRYRVWRNNQTKNYMIGSYENGNYKLLGGTIQQQESELASLSTNGYLMVDAGDVASPQGVEASIWSNIIAKFEEIKTNHPGSLQK